MTIEKKKTLRHFMKNEMCTLKAETHQSDAELTPVVVVTCYWAELYLYFEPTNSSFSLKLLLIGGEIF